MNTTNITMVRLYLHEGKGQLDNLLKRLRDWEKLRGLTVFRGIAGFGESGEIHEAKWTDLAMDLPIVVEFFDEPDKVSAILQHLEGVVKPEHMVWWQAETNA